MLVYRVAVHASAGTICFTLQVLYNYTEKPVQDNNSWVSVTEPFVNRWLLYKGRFQCDSLFGAREARCFREVAA